MTNTDTTSDDHPTPPPAPVSFARKPRPLWHLPALIVTASLMVGAALISVAVEIDEAIDAIDTEEVDSQDDATVRSCGVDESTGAATAAIRVTNDTSGSSTYVIEVVFTDDDGSTLGRTDAVLTEVAPDTTEVVHVDEDVDDGSDVACRIGNVERFAA
jgi:hypothetical protein